MSDLSPFHGVLVPACVVSHLTSILTNFFQKSGIRCESIELSLKCMNTLSDSQQ